jgi:hypothetical protein
MTKDAVNPLSRHVRHRLRGTCASHPTLPQLGLAVEQQSPRPEDLESDEAGLQRQSSCRTGSPRPNRSQGRVQRMSRPYAVPLFCPTACEPAGTPEDTGRFFESRIHARENPVAITKNTGLAWAFQEILKKEPTPSAAVVFRPKKLVRGISMLM